MFGEVLPFWLFGNLVINGGVEAIVFVEAFELSYRYELQRI